MKKEEKEEEELRGKNPFRISQKNKNNLAFI